jgi:acetylornithine deacetylase/succinyl-diaminopimelate desuccinylase-like protein
MPRLEDVLSHIDANLGPAIERLFALLRIRSISTDPAYASECRACAEWHARDLAGIGFDAAVRDTPGHPIVVAHDRGARDPSALFYGHYFAKARRALTDEWGKPAVFIGGGGSIPVTSELKKALGMDVILAGFALEDDRIHKPEREVQRDHLPQGHAVLGSHPGRAGDIGRAGWQPAATA